MITNYFFRSAYLFKGELYLKPKLRMIMKSDINTGGGGTQMSRGYQARPKIHVIRVVFQDQALYARTLFRGAKTCKIGKKGVFLVI